MLLISIVVLLTYSSIQIVEKQFGDWQRDKMKLLERSRLIDALSMDVHRSTDFNLSMDNKIDFTDYEDNIYTYYFKKGQVIREMNQLSDTLNILSSLALQVNDERKYLRVVIFEGKDTLRYLFPLPANAKEEINKFFLNED